MSIQPFSATMLIAFIVSPAARYISAAARGSLMLLAQSAFIFVKVVLSSEPKNSLKNLKLVFNQYITDLLTCARWNILKSVYISRAFLGLAFL